MIKITITDEHKKACQLLKSRKEWEYVEEILRTYLEALKDITQLDANEKQEDKNIVFLGRLKAYEYLNNFLKAIDLLSQPTKKVDAKDRYE